MFFCKMQLIKFDWLQKLYNYFQTVEAYTVMQKKWLSLFTFKYIYSAVGGEHLPYDK